MRDWVLFSSSSGETFRAAYQALSPEARSSLKATFFDRPCGALQVMGDLDPSVPALLFAKADFERAVLEQLQAWEQPVVLLCGFFGILSGEFLQGCPGPVVNTHPSLLPAFPGLEKKVHARAAETVCLSGFSVHLVTEELDGGPILFQVPVWLDPDQDPGQLRQKVRATEQRWLPWVWERILRSDLNREDVASSARSLRQRLGLGEAPFTEKTTTMKVVPA